MIMILNPGDGSFILRCLDRFWSLSSSHEMRSLVSREASNRDHGPTTLVFRVPFLVFPNTESIARLRRQLASRLTTSSIENNTSTHLIEHHII